MPKLLEEVRGLIRTRHYSYRTEEAYLYWIRQYILFHGKRHPAEMGPAEVSQFLTHLAVKREVAASTQNQALAALLFLYRNVLQQDLPWLENVTRAKQPAHIPLVLTRAEVQATPFTIGPTELAAGESALWSRASPQGMPEFEGKRSGLRLSANRSARRKGEQGPPDDAADQCSRGVKDATCHRQNTPSTRPRGWFWESADALCAGAKIPVRRS